MGTPSTTPGSGTIAAIEHTRQLGLDHLEIAWVRSVRVSDDMCAQIKETAQKHDVTLSIHAPYFINLNSQTAEKMEASDNRLLTAARKGFLAGAPDIVFHPGSYHQQPPEQVYERVKEKLVELTGILREEGVEVILRPETMGKQAMFGTLDEVLQLSRDLDNVLPCVDWAHLHARTGDGTFNSYDEFDAAMKSIKEMLGEEGLKTLHNHMSGITYTAKGEKSHLPLNEADLLYRDLIQVFVDNDVEGTIGVEAPHPFHVADCLTLQATHQRLVDQRDETTNKPRHG